jgi:pimeloyl-ACP methyl ester carboxylesterase
MIESHRLAHRDPAVWAFARRASRRGFVALLAVLLCALVATGRVADATAAATCDVATHEVAIGGGTIEYNTAGSGRPIVMLHGLFADKEQWRPLMCLLADAGYATIAPDLPGYGKSTGFRLRDYRLENQVDLLQQFVASIGVGTFDLAGNSMGGTIAALYTRAHPRTVRTLAFMGAPLGIIDWNQPLKEAIYQGINPFIPIDVAQFDLELKLLFVNPPSLPEDAKEAAVKEYGERNRHFQQVWDIVNLYDGVLQERMIVRAPTLIIWGERDSIYNVDGAARLRERMHRAMVVKLPNAGHLLHLENAADVAPIYVRFLQRVVF